MIKKLETLSIFRSSVNIQVSAEEVPQPGPSSGAVPKQPLPPRPPAVPPRRTPPVINQLPTGPRLQAFAVSTPTKPPGGGGSGSANKTTKQLETRQRQLEMLRRMEER